jgi:CelD/BcsL family acetyltransferase involved in cellulose biosynthesis
MGNSKLQVYNSFNSELEELWLDFQSKNSFYLFQTHDWLKYWFTCVGKPSYSLEVFIILVTKNDNVVAIFPFCIRRIFSINILEFIGGGQSDYNEPLISLDISKDEYTEIWDSVLVVIKTNDVYEFQRIPDRGVNNQFISHIKVTDRGASYSLNFCKGTDIKSYVSKRLLKDNARMVRRLSESGSLKYVFATSISQYDEIVEVCLNQKEKRYIATGARNIFNDKNVFNFYKNLFKSIHLSADVNIHLSALILDEVILATHLGAVYEDRFYYLLPTFAAGEYEKYSPGRLLLEYLVNWSLYNKLNIFDFTVGSESYKKKWCNQEMLIYRHLSSNSIKGLLYVKIKQIILWGKNNIITRSFAMYVIKYIHGLKYFLMNSTQR